LAFVDPDGFVRVKRSSDVQTWSPTTLPAGLQSGITPTLVHVPWNHFFVLVITDPHDGLISFLTSKDGGLSFALDKKEISARSFVPIGFMCVESTQQCMLVKSGLGVNSSFRNIYEFNNSGQLRGIVSAGGYYDTLGDALGASRGQGATSMILLSLRNEFLRTYVRTLDSMQEVAGLSLSSAQIPWYWSTLNRANDWRRPVSDSAPSPMWDQALQKWLVWYTYNSRYSSEYNYLSLP
jgi:hypothetical protein